jgi:hypothetical protein
MTAQAKSYYNVVEHPSVSITTPANGATYIQGQVVDANYSCGDPDGGNDVKSCVGTLDGNTQLASGSPLNTSMLGQHALTVVATDTFNKTAQQTVDYTVVQPVSTGGGNTGTTSGGNGGGTGGGNTGGTGGGNTGGATGTTGGTTTTQTTKPPCAGLKRKALARCKANLVRRQALAACKQMKRKKQRAACIRQANATYQRELKLINKIKK